MTNRANRWLEGGLDRALNCGRNGRGFRAASKRVMQALFVIVVDRVSWVERAHLVISISEEGFNQGRTSVPSAT